MKRALWLGIVMAILAICPSVQGQYENDTNTVVLLHMDETGGALVLDASSNGNNGTANGTSVVTGYYGNARSFAGTSGDYISIPHSTSLAISNAISIEAWINFSVGGTINPRIMSKGHTTGYGFYTVGTDSARYIGFQAVNGGVELSMSITSRSRIYTDKWYHVAYTYDGSLARVYIDGILDTAKAASGTLPQNSIDINIGRNSSNLADNFKGRIDDLRISNIARVSGFRGGYWHLDEVSGTNVADASGWDNHGFARNTTIVNGRAGKARYFNGTSSHYVAIPPSASLNLTKAITIDAWINFSIGGTINPRILSKGHTTGYGFYTAGTGSARALGFQAVSGGTQLAMSISSKTLMTAGTWNHVAYRYNGQHAMLYINGILDTLHSATGDLPISTDSLNIGRNSSNYSDNFLGIIDEVRISDGVLSVIASESESPTYTSDFELFQNYPNPFNPATTIGYAVGGSAHREVRLAVYDALGRQVAVLVDGRKAPGRYSATWDARGMASGVYFCHITSGGFHGVTKMLLCR